MHKPNAVLVDVDGTLVDVTGIRHLVEGGSRDFNAFHKASIDCQPNFPVLQRVQELHDLGLSVVIVSGRDERFRRLTDFWLALWAVPCDRLLMRCSGDSRSDVLVKKEFFNELSQHFQIVEAIDDREDLLEMWKSLKVERVVDVQNLLNAKGF
jgi:FMN phosphatase YigB (HAD superfamily)